MTRTGAVDVLAYATDISDRHWAELLFGQASAGLGWLDAVVRNASVAAFGRVTDVRADMFDMASRSTFLAPRTSPGWP